MSDSLADQEAAARHMRTASLQAYVLQSSTNAAIMAALGIAIVAWLWNHVPHAWLLTWACLVGAMVVLAQSTARRFKQQPMRQVSQRAMRRATFWAGCGGAVWGAVAPMVAHLPSDTRMAPLLMIVALACGAATTLAAIPAACAAFVTAILLPSSVALGWSGKPDNLALGLMGLPLLGAMIAASRHVHRGFAEAVLAERRNAALLREIDVTRRDWLELAGQSEAFAFIDRDQRILMWNESFRRVFELPDGLPQRGDAYLDVLAKGVGPHPSFDPAGDFDAWIARQRDVLAFPEVPIEQHLASGRWLRSVARPCTGGRVLVNHMDITEMKGRAAAEDARLLA